MSTANRIKETTTATNTATVTLGGAVSSFRPFSFLVAGVKRTGLKVRVGPDSSGAWLIGAYDLTSDNTLTRRAILDSSANGADVTLASGAKEVELTFTAAQGDRVDSGTSTRMVFASSLLTSDTDLSFASNTTGVDQVAKAQQLLDLAIDGPLLLIWDVAVSVGMSSNTTSMRIRSNTKVMALPGCGAKFMPESPVAMWRNYNPTIVPGSIIDTNIEICGGIWHGNSANQSVRETAANGGTSIMDFVGVRKLRMTGPMQLLRARGFAWRGTNVYNVDIEDGTVEYETGQNIVSTDGYHFNGPSRYISMRNLRLLNCADDAIAFNADDAWVAAQNAGTAGPYVSWGEISDVTVDGVYLQGYVCGIRMLSGASRMDRFVFRNIQGKTGGYWLIINGHIPADTTQSGPGNVGQVLIDGVHMENVPVSGWFPAQAHINCKIEQITFQNVSKSKFNNVQYPALTIGSSADIGQVAINGYKSRSYNGGTYLTDQILVVNGAKVGTLRVSNSDFYASSTTSGSPITIQAGATIGQLIGNGNTGINFSSFVSNQGTLTKSHFPEDTLNFMDTTVAAASTWVLQSNTPWVEDTSIPNKLTYVGPKAGVVGSARKTTSDGFGGNVQMSSRIRFSGGLNTNGALHASMIVRGSGIVPWSTVQSGYAFDVFLEGSGGIKLFKAVSGTQTNIGSPVTVLLAFDTDYDFKLIAKTTSGTTTVSLSVQRVSDGLYLQTNGTWGASAVQALTATDSSLPAAAGEWGLYGYNEGPTAATISYTNIAIAAAP